MGYPNKQYTKTNQLLLMRLVFFLILTPVIFAACENDINEVNRLFSKEETKVEKAKSVEMLYSDSAVLQLRITSPVLLRHLEGKEPWQEFPEGIQVEFFAEGGKVTGNLTAQYAIRSESDNKITVQDSVVWQSLQGERLETEELIWDEAADKVHTDKFVIVRRPDEIIYGYGFESNQKFTQWRIRAIEGRIKANDLTKDFKN